MEAFRIVVELAFDLAAVTTANSILSIIFPKPPEANQYVSAGMVFFEIAAQLFMSYYMVREVRSFILGDEFDPTQGLIFAAILGSNTFLQDKIAYLEASMFKGVSQILQGTREAATGEEKTGEEEAMKDIKEDYDTATKRKNKKKHS